MPGVSRTIEALNIWAISWVNDSGSAAPNMPSAVRLAMALSSRRI